MPSLDDQAQPPPGGDDPDAVLAADLPYDRKLQMLQDWAMAARRQQGEGEAADDQLRRVERALRELQAAATTDRDQPEGAPQGEVYQPQRPRH